MPGRTVKATLFVMVVDKVCPGLTVREAGLKLVNHPVGNEEDSAKLEAVQPELSRLVTLTV